MITGEMCKLSWLILNLSKPLPGHTKEKLEKYSG